MKFPYIPRGDSEIEEMFKTIGVSSFEELLAPVDPKFLLEEALDLPPAKSELEVDRFVVLLAGRVLPSPDHESPSIAPRLGRRPRRHAGRLLRPAGGSLRLSVRGQCALGETGDALEPA